MCELFDAASRLEKSERKLADLLEERRLAENAENEGFAPAPDDALKNLDETILALEAEIESLERVIKYSPADAEI